jgi:hypothetical protein
MKLVVVRLLEVLFHSFLDLLEQPALHQPLSVFLALCLTDLVAHRYFHAFDQPVSAWAVGISNVIAAAVCAGVVLHGQHKRRQRVRDVEMHIRSRNIMDECILESLQTIREALPSFERHQDATAEIEVVRKEIQAINKRVTVDSDVLESLAKIA